MAYREAMEAAGAVVHCYQDFGSYQGEWWAKVTYNGKTGWVNGSYGSCSGCDAFEAEFGWDEANDPLRGDKLKNFGESYLNCILSQKKAEKEASSNLSWDLEAEEMVKYIKDNHI